MASEKNTPQNWKIARARWESEPKCSYSDLTELLGITKQNVFKRAKKEGWQKKLNLSNLRERAHAVADRKSSIASRNRPKEALRGDDLQNPNGLPSAEQVFYPEPPPLKEKTPEQIAVAEEDAAGDVRAQVLKKHRDEWPAIRATLYKAIKQSDDKLVRTVKSAAETMKIIQEGERKAWGLDVGDVAEAFKVVIERTEGVKSVS